MTSDTTGARRKREADAEDFRRLLRRLSSDPDQAWQAYSRLRQKLVLFFEYHCRFQAEELAEEVLDRIAKKPDSQGITNVAEFAFGVARNLRKEVARKNLLVRVADAGVVEERLGSPKDSEDLIITKIDSERKLECFLRCLKRLDAEDRALLFQYYPVDDAGLEERRQRLAQEHQLNMSALRTRMARLREKMERCFEHCRAHLQGKVTRISF